MGKQLQIKPGYNRIWFYSVMNTGTAILTDEEYDDLPLPLKNLVTVIDADVEDPDRSGPPVPPATVVTWSIVEYDAGWPARPVLPEGYPVMWINRTDDTQPPAGVDGYVSGLDVALVAVPEP